MKTEKGFRKLLVWQKAHQWVLLIYKLTEDEQAESLRAETGFLLHRLIESLDRK